MEHKRFKSTIAVLTAVVTVLGAMTACLATFAVSNAGDADFDGLDASIRAQRADIINNVQAYEHYRAFTDYLRYDELGSLLYDPNADRETSVANGAFQREVWGVAQGIGTTFFSPRYINPDGQYDLERELQEAWAQDTVDQDMNPQPYFEESDRLRTRSSFLTANMIVFAVSFWFFTLAQATETRVKFLWAGLGVLMGLGGILGILIGSFML